MVANVGKFFEVGFPSCVLCLRSVNSYFVNAVFSNVRMAWQINNFVGYILTISANSW